MNQTTIVFVHGLGGDLAATWGKFEELIASDPALKDFKTFSIGYPTSLLPLPWKKYPRIQTLADALRTELNLRLPDSAGQDVILVCHSLGGLIGRRYLLDEVKLKRALRVRGLLLYSVPNSGSGLAAVASQLSWWRRNYQLDQLCKDSDLLIDLDKDWETFEMKSRIKARYVVAGLDNVVDEQSARSSWGNPNVEVLSQRGHINIAKPEDLTDLSYLVLKQFALSLAAPDPTEVMQRYAISPMAKAPSTAPLKKGYRVIGFDLDGTLLRGIKFSWTAVWEHFGFPKVVHQDLMRDYVRNKITYQEWCDKACAQFKAKGLRRADFPKIVSEITVTNNLESTLSTLKASGFILALISGGIDVFITEKIPKAADYFDYICINRLLFDVTGLISGVEATPFDFEGKATGLEAICKRHGCTLQEAVFVGEGFNDAEVVEKAGLSIAYPPGETVIDAAAKRVEENDLSKILELVG